MATALSRLASSHRPLAYRRTVAATNGQRLPHNLGRSASWARQIRVAPRLAISIGGIVLVAVGSGAYIGSSLGPDAGSTP